MQVRYGLKFFFVHGWGKYVAVLIHQDIDCFPLRIQSLVHWNLQLLSNNYPMYAIYLSAARCTFTSCSPGTLW